MFRQLARMARVFLFLGIRGGGSKTFHRETVIRQAWLTDEGFHDLSASLQVLPGPHTLKMALSLGFLRGGWMGLGVAGLCFFLPGVLLSTLLAWAYLRFGGWPVPFAMLTGVRSVVPALLLGVTYRLGRCAVTGWRPGFLGGAVMLVALTDFPAIYAFLGGGLIGMLWFRARNLGNEQSALLFPLSGSALTMAAGIPVVGPSLWAVGVFFAGFGALLFGSGYLLMVFVHSSLVVERGWLAYGHVLDALAFAQLVPGSVLSMSAFLGFVITGGNWLGALVGAGGVFAPVLLLKGLLHRLIPNPAQSAWLWAFKDSMAASATGVLAALAVEMGRFSLETGSEWVLFLVAGVLILWRRVTPGWLVLMGALAGWALVWVGT